MAATLDAREVVVGGVRLAYIERAAETDADRPPLLLLHGLIATAATFSALIAEMPADRRVVALNLPGFAADQGALDLSFAGFATLVCGFAESISLHRPVLLGHSHGGAIALRIASSSPDFLAGLILMCPAHPFSYRERRLVAFYNSALGQIFARTLPYLPRWAQEIGFRRMLGPEGRKRHISSEPYRERLRVPGTVSQIMGILKSWVKDMELLAADLQAQPLTAGTLFLWGDADTVVPVSTAAALQKHIIMWEQFTLRGVGHLPSEEAPEDCASLICTWLVWLATHPKYTHTSEWIAAGKTYDVTKAQTPL